ncbi:HmuY family protein [Leptospira idonii]|uniref:HmuY family protein n=1 Tax=Leptospira idonii TaxID=1193500 RepID=UPI001FE926C7|nr:HmuY family protein [Leptospira idonii]
MFINQLVADLLKANDPNSLDKVVYSRAETDGTTLTRINATNMDFYIYFSFRTNSQIPFSSVNTTNWDIAFNRYKLATNSGTSNSFGLGGACLSNQTTVTAAASIDRSSQNCSDTPSTNFVIDAKTSTQGIGGVGAEFIGNALLTDWFNYQIGNLTTKGLIYIVRSGAGSSSNFAFKIENYYSDAGTSAYPTFRWKKLP